MTHPPRNDTVSASEIAEALGGRRSGSGWKARCPAHDDREPSLSISDAGGTVLVHCFGGCEQERVLSALREMGLWGSTKTYPDDQAPAFDHLDGRSPRTPMQEPKRPDDQAYPVDHLDPAQKDGHLATKMYEYRDLQGKLIATKKRVDYLKDGARHKACTWCMPDGTTELTPAAKRRLARALYGGERLPDVPQTRPVELGEGEKVKEALESVSMVAVSGPHGANTEWTRARARLLKGRPVRLWPDNDGPGEKQMQEAADALLGVAAEVLMVTVPGLPHKGDIADLIQKGCGRDYVEELAARAVAVEDDPRAPQPILVPASTITPQKIQWIWDPCFARRGLTIIDGDPGAGKSFVVSAIATSCTLGAPLPFQTVEPEPMDVLMLIAEDALDETVIQRLRDMGADTSRITFLDGVEYETDDDLLLLNPTGLAVLRRAAAKVRPGLIVIDPLVAYLGGVMDSHRANEVRALLRPLDLIAKDLGSAVVATRHLNKNAGGPAIYRGSASMDFMATVRSAIFIAEHPNELGTQVMAHQKSNRAKAPSLAFTLGNGVFGWKPGTVDLTANDLARGPDTSRSSKLEEAMAWLLEHHAERPLSAQQVVQSATSAGHSEVTLRRAFHELQGRSEPERNEDGTVRRWVWMPFVKASAIHTIKEGVLDDLEKTPGIADSVPAEIRLADARNEPTLDKSPDDQRIRVQSSGSEDEREYSGEHGAHADCSICHGQDPLCWLCGALAVPRNDSVAEEPRGETDGDRPASPAVSRGCPECDSDATYPDRYGRRHCQMCNAWWLVPS